MIVPYNLMRPSPSRIAREAQGLTQAQLASQKGLTIHDVWLQEKLEANLAFRVYVMCCIFRLNNAEPDMPTVIDQVANLRKSITNNTQPNHGHQKDQPTTKGGPTMNILKAYKAGLEAAREHKNWSRFDCATFLHGYDPFLTFDELAEITQEIAVELGRKW